MLLLMLLALGSLTNSDHVCRNQEKALPRPLWNSTGVVQQFENVFSSSQAKTADYSITEGQEWQRRGIQIDYIRYGELMCFIHTVFKQRGGPICHLDYFMI